MYFKWLPLVVPFYLITPCHAEEIPSLGKMKAQSHQICGTGIDVEILRTDENTIILALKNKETHNFDLFISNEQSLSQVRQSSFTPVRYDALSENYIPVKDDELDIMWGGSLDDDGKITYKLALGPKIYNCGSLQEWPSEKANLIYGETA